MSSKPELKVSAIREGTVIDHLPSQSTLKVLQILKLPQTDQIISVAYNLPSKSMGTKGIIKIGGKSLSQREIAKITIIAPESTMNVVEDYKVTDKIKLKIPKEVVGVVKCINPNCITNNEKVKTIFSVIKHDPLTIRCKYCEEIIEKSNIIIK